jgi:hypothetical protein
MVKDGSRVHLARMDGSLQEEEDCCVVATGVVRAGTPRAYMLIASRGCRRTGTSMTVCEGGCCARALTWRLWSLSCY